MRELSDPLTEEDKAWMKSRNMEVPEESADDDDVDPGDEDADYSDWTIPQLQKELRARTLPVSGNKEELVARLEKDDED
jgi:hypothetical protein